MSVTCLDFRRHGRRHLARSISARVRRPACACQHRVSASDQVDHRSACCSARWFPGSQAPAVSKHMGRIGLKAIVYFEIATTLALASGLGAVNIVRPGRWPAIWSIRLPKSVFRKLSRHLSRFSSTPFRPASSTRWREEKYCRSSSSPFCSALPARCRRRRCSRGDICVVARRSDVPLYEDT